MSNWKLKQAKIDTKTFEYACEIFLNLWDVPGSLFCCLIALHRLSLTYFSYQLMSWIEWNACYATKSVNSTCFAILFQFRGNSSSTNDSDRLQNRLKTVDAGFKCFSLIINEKLSDMHIQARQLSKLIAISKFLKQESPNNSPKSPDESSREISQIPLFAPRRNQNKKISILIWFLWKCQSKSKWSSNWIVSTF